MAEIITENILGILSGIEENENVTVLYACESAAGHGDLNLRTATMMSGSSMCAGLPATYPWIVAKV